MTWIEFSEEFGQFAGLLFGAFFSHLFGFVGPFAFMGIVFTVFAIIHNSIINFEKTGPLSLAVIKDDNIEMAFVQKSSSPEDIKDMIENDE